MDDINWDDDQLRAAGINKRKLVALVKRLRDCSRRLRELNLYVYGESGAGHLIHTSRPTHDTHHDADLGSVVASVGFGFDGGGW